MKRSLSSLEANSVLLEILMLEKSATSLPSRMPGILCALEKTRGKREKRAQENLPASMPCEMVSSTNQRLCITCVAVKANHVILAGDPKGQFILDHEILSITCRVNYTGPSSEPPVHAHHGSRPSSQPYATHTRSECAAGAERGHIPHDTHIQGPR